MLLTDVARGSQLRDKRIKFSKAPFSSHSRRSIKSKEALVSEDTKTEENTGIRDSGNFGTLNFDNCCWSNFHTEFIATKCLNEVSNNQPEPVLSQNLSFNKLNNLTQKPTTSIRKLVREKSYDNRKMFKEKQYPEHSPSSYIKVIEKVSCLSNLCPAVE